MTAARSLTSAQTNGTRTDRQDALRERLEQERDDLLGQLAAFAVVPALTATTGSGETEHIVSGIEHGVQTALDAQVEGRLAEVVDAKGVVTMSGRYDWFLQRQTGSTQ